LGEIRLGEMGLGEMGQNQETIISITLNIISSRRARLCHSKSSVCLSVCLRRSGMFFTQVGRLRKYDG